MRLHVADLAAGALELLGADLHYLARVLRARRGDRVLLFDGAGREADATVEEIGEDRMRLAVGAPRPARVSGVPVALLVGLLKGEKMDLVVQKATELGAARIVPLSTAHAVVRLDDDRRDARRARWQRIAREAARQSGRAEVPEIEPVAGVAEALAAAPPHALRLLFHEGPGGTPLRAVLAGGRPVEVVAAVGPEGGFAPAEVEAARAAGFAVVSLGARVLRAETAAIAALAVLAYHLDA